MCYIYTVGLHTYVLHALLAKKPCMMYIILKVRRHIANPTPSTDVQVPGEHTCQISSRSYLKRWTLWDLELDK